MVKNMMRIVGVALVMGLLMISCQPPQEQETAVEQTYGAAEVKAYKVHKEKISESLFYTGVIEARKTMSINPDIGGKVAKIYVDEGDRVRQGQVLAELDTRAIRLQLEQAEAQLAVAESSHQDAKLNLERWDRLKKESAVSDQQYEQIKLAYDASASQLQQARAAVNLAKYNLDVSIMEAPFDGIIAAKIVEEGDIVNPMMGGFGSATGVLTLMDFSSVKIEIEVPHIDVVRIKKGQSAELKIPAYPDQVFHGRVTVVNLAADPTSKKFGVEVEVANPDLLLKPNTFGEVILEVSSNAEALVIPQEAVLENAYVFVVENNLAKRKEIQIGLQNEEFLEVIQGIQAGNLVIVEGNYGLVDGAEVEVKEVIQ